jgi:hypothetical protein
MGVVLLFSKERGRRADRRDATRRWGVFNSYVVLLLGAAQMLVVPALVLAGIAALFQAMPLHYQPHVTPFFVHVSTGYLCYGPSPRPISAVLLVAFSSIVMLLACNPLFDALRSSGPKWAAAILLAPLALFSLVHLVRAGRSCVGLPTLTWTDVPSNELYFWPGLLVARLIGGEAPWGVPQAEPSAFYVELVKWCVVFVIAVWLSVAQFGAWRRGGKIAVAAPDAAARPSQ